MNNDPAVADITRPRLEVTYALAFANVVGVTVGAVPFWAGTGGLGWLAWVLCPITPTALMWPIPTVILAVLIYLCLTFVGRRRPAGWPTQFRRVVLTITILWFVLIGLWFGFTLLLMS